MRESVKNRKKKRTSIPLTRMDEEVKEEVKGPQSNQLNEKTSSSNFSAKVYENEHKSSNQLTLQWEKTPINQGSSHFLNVNTFSSSNDKSPQAKEKKALFEKLQELQSRSIFKGRDESKKSSINDNMQNYNIQSPRRIVGGSEEEMKEETSSGYIKERRESGEDGTTRKLMNRPTITLSTTGFNQKVILNSKREEGSNAGTPQRKKKTQSPTKFKSFSGSNNLGVGIDQSANQLKMDRSSLLMRTHMLSYKKRQRMNPVDQMVTAVQEDKIHELEELFMIYPNSLIDSRDSKNNTLLMIASKTGSLEIVQLLLNKGANPNSVNNNGDTALHFALAFGNFEVADILINNGADQTIKNFSKKTPWDMH